MHRRHLGQERLGRGDAALGPRVRIQDAVRLPGDGRPHRVGDGDDVRLLAPGVPDGLQRVDGLAGLRDAQREGVRVEDRIPVAELAGDVDLHGQARPVLDRVLGHQSGVKGRATGHHEHLVDPLDLVFAHPELVEVQAPGRVDPAPEGVPDRLGLLVDLLQHEVVEPALLRGGEVPLHLDRGRLDLVPVEIDQPNRIGAHLGDLPLGQRHEAARPLKHRRHVGGQHVLAPAEPDHEGRGDLHPDDDVRFLGRHDDQRVRAHQLGDHGPHRFHQVAVVRLFQEVSHALRVGLGREHVAGLGQPLPKILEVLDDAVVDDGHGARAVHVGVGIAIGGRPMRGPARMAHPDGALDPGGLGQRGFEVRELPGPLHDGQRAVDDGDSSRVVSPVFQAP